MIISRALVEIFSHDFLGAELRFRGGTALNKIVFPEPLRYSEDIDLLRTTAGPIGPILDAMREVLEPWLGKASYAASPDASKLRFHVLAEDDPEARIRLKIEINLTEIEAFDRPALIPYAVKNPWFTGGATIASFSAEELLATKLRALLQRDKWRDLFDLYHALNALPDLDIDRVVELFSDISIGRGGPFRGRKQSSGCLQSSHGQTFWATFARSSLLIEPTLSMLMLEERHLSGCLLMLWAACLVTTGPKPKKWHFSWVYPRSSSSHREFRELNPKGEPFISSVRTGSFPDISVSSLAG
ncbi:MAG: nucleotidyl transferase AbiEii/AbiGii toxin family protein [Roseovarius sp.]|nr:nucleotidyl transferase AbiEii/AbiGii toxin family protein [Roseovarius sp.]